VDEAVLDRVYRHDVEIMDRVEEAAEAVEKLGASPDDAKAALATTSAQIQALDRSWDVRVDMLKGLE
jgi:hypothetical protein